MPVLAEFEGECTLPAETKIGFYRIAQEALNNVAKHSGATKASVLLRCGREETELIIEDNGKGFDVSGVQGKSMGMGIMRERAKAIGAFLEIKSTAGRGTEITASRKAAAQR